MPEYLKNQQARDEDAARFRRPTAASSTDAPRLTPKQCADQLEMYAEAAEALGDAGNAHGLRRGAEFIRRYCVGHP